MGTQGRASIDVRKGGTQKGLRGGHCDVIGSFLTEKEQAIQ